jgi:hypothetical protein
MATIDSLLFGRAIINNVPFDPLPTSRTNALKFVSIFMMGITLIAVSLRFYCRIFIVRTPGWDDWVCLAALVCVVSPLCYKADSGEYTFGVAKLTENFRYSLLGLILAFLDWYGCEILGIHL